MIRLYFNVRGPQPWSVDHGEGTPERTATHVSILRGGCFTKTRELKEGVDPEKTPKAWIEWPDDRRYAEVAALVNSDGGIVIK